MLRSSYDPDPRPEDGEHQMEIGVYAGSANAQDLYRELTLLRHPAISCAVMPHDGVLPEEFSLFRIENAVLSSCRRNEEGQIAMRMFNPGLEAEHIRLTGDGVFEPSGLFGNGAEMSEKVLAPQEIVGMVLKK